MNTIPAKHYVEIDPDVIGAGGRALDLNGLVLSALTTVPIGTVASFSDALSVGAYFGPNSTEKQIADRYFIGINGATATPGALLFAQRPTGPVAAYLRGGRVSGLSIAQLNAITGTVILTVDGRAITTSSIDLSSADSFSDAAATIQTAINAADTGATSFTASIAPAPSSGVTGNLKGTTLTLHGTPKVFLGSAITGTGIPANTVVTGFLTGTGGAGTYVVNNTATTTPAISITVTNGLMTVTGSPVGTVAIGQVIAGTSVTIGTQIVDLGTGTGGTGTYYVVPGQTVSSTVMTVQGIGCTYDSNFGAFVVTSGTVGTGSSITVATGTASTALKLTTATGAVLSQGAAPYRPLGVLMDQIIGITQNWAAFMSAVTLPAGLQLQLAAWVSAQNNRYAFADWSINPDIVSGSDTTSGFYQIDQAGYGSVVKVYNPSAFPAIYNAAMVLAYAASLDFQALDGRATLAYRSQDGQPSGVTDDSTATLLEATGINYYGSTATANQGFTFMFPGAITGKFAWADSFFNQIWLNNELQLALLELLTTAKSIPYNSAGYALIRAACMDPITAALNFGAIRIGVTLSAAQIAETKAAAGLDISVPLETAGFYLQILDASAQVRGQRGSPPISLWYMDGESVQKIKVASVLVQ